MSASTMATSALKSIQSMNPLAVAAIVAAHAVALGVLRQKNGADADAVSKTATTKTKNNAVNAEDAVAISLPAWALEYERSLQDKVFTTEEEMMTVAIELSARNVRENTGGYVDG